MRPRAGVEERRLLAKIRYAGVKLPGGAGLERLYSGPGRAEFPAGWLWTAVHNGQRLAVGGAVRRRDLSAAVVVVAVVRVEHRGRTFWEVRAGE